MKKSDLKIQLEKKKMICCLNEEEEHRREMWFTEKKIKEQYWTL